MKKMTLLALAMTMSLASAQEKVVGAEPVVEKEKAGGYVASTGGPTGTYIRVGHNLNSLVPGGKVIQSAGSLENLNRLMSDEAQVGIVQADALAWFYLKHPDSKNVIKSIGPLYKECLHAAIKKDGKVEDEDSLQDKSLNINIAVGEKGGGTEVSFRYMKALEKGYKSSSYNFESGSTAFGTLLQATKTGANEVDAIFWMTRPNINDKYLRIVRENEDLEMISINDSDLNDKHEVLGRPIYTFQEIVVKEGTIVDDKVETICVDALLVARKDLDKTIKESIADVMLTNKKALLK